MNTHDPLPGLEVTEYRGLDLIQLGNTDIVCEYAAPAPDTKACTLPIYPLPSQLPQRRRA